MPKRTNAYQRLVKLVHALYAPKGATVRESEMVKAPGFGDLREIDVYMETPVGPYSIKFAIEAKNHRRKLNVNDVETIVGKYRCGGALIVNEVVLVCPKGYSVAANSKAKANGIKLVTFSEIDADTPVSTPLSRIKFEVKPHATKLELIPFPNADLPAEAITRGMLYCKCCGRPTGKPSEFASNIVQKLLAAESAFTDVFNQQLLSGSACGRTNVPMGRHHLKLDGKYYKLLRLHFHVHAARKESDLEFKTYEMSSDEMPTKRVRHGVAQIDNQEINVVFDADSRDRITVNFRDCSGD